jgi:uncharacterized protein (TIGR02246 family)
MSNRGLSTSLLGSTLLLAACASGGRAAAAGLARDPEAAGVLAANEQFTRAVLANDTLAMEDAMAPEYVFLSASGARLTRQAVLDLYATRTVQRRSYRADSVEVRRFGDAAIVTAVMVQEGGYVAGPRAGTDLSGRLRSTRVYVRRNGRWQVVSAHESRMPEP